MQIKGMKADYFSKDSFIINKCNSNIFNNGRMVRMANEDNSKYGLGIIKETENIKNKTIVTLNSHSINVDNTIAQVWVHKAG